MSRARWVVLGVLVALALLWWAASTGAPAVSTESVAEPAAPRGDAVLPPGTAQAPTGSAEPEAQPQAAPEQPATPAVAQQDKPRGEPDVPPPARSGPVEELERLYASEPRASDSTGVESVIEAQFRRKEVPAGLLKSVLCRTTVCRIETRWSPDRAQGFMSALMHLVSEPAGDQRSFQQHIAIAPEADPAADSSHAITVYVRLEAAP